MKNIQEIETKILGLLSIKSCKEGLNPDEKRVAEKLNKKYRDVNGKLVKGSYFVNNEGNWVMV